jgi:hypothetical protein
MHLRFMEGTWALAIRSFLTRRRRPRPPFPAPPVVKPLFFPMIACPQNSSGPARQKETRAGNERIHAWAFVFATTTRVF